jgi:hypothetical protein
VRVHQDGGLEALKVLRALKVHSAGFIVKDAPGETLADGRAPGW